MQRMSRLLRADLHAVIDQLEEPEVLLRQAIREMEEVLADDRRQLDAATSERGRLVSRSRAVERDIASIDAELDLCFDAGNDDLARSLCRRKLECEAILKSIARRSEENDETIESLGTRIRERGARLESIRHKAALAADDDMQYPAAEPCDPERHAPSADDVEIAFLREQHKRSAS